MSQNGQIRRINSASVCRAMKFRVVVGAYLLSMLGALLGDAAADAKAGEIKLDQAGQQSDIPTLDISVDGGNEADRAKSAAAVPVLANEGVLFSDVVFSEAEIAALKTALMIPVTVSADKQLAEQYGVVFPGVHYVADSGTFTHAVSLGGSDQIVAEVRQLVAQDLIPAFREITESNFKEYEDTGLPTAYVVSHSQELDKFAWVAEVARPFKQQLNLALLDYPKTEFFLNSAGITATMTPCVFILTEKGGNIVKYLLRELAGAAALREFVTGFLENTLTPFVMSEDLPSPAEAVNEFGVQKLVMHNFKEVVMDPLKDVLVVYHVTWCGFCRKFLPELDRVSQLLQDAGVATVAVGKLLMSANDVPLDVEIDAIRAFPTIRLYKKGTNQEVEFSNQTKPADAESLLAFLKEHADLPAGLSLAPAAKANEPKEAKQPADIQVDL